MNRLKLWIIAALAAALALTAIAGVSAQPQPPLVFTGTVDGGEAATGLDVRAYIDGTDCTESTSATLTRSDGKTHYWVRVAKSSQTAGCGTDGDTVRFRIDGKWADQKGTFDGTKAKVTLNLTLSDAPPTATVYVAVWRSVSNPSILYLSTRPEGGDWTTHDDDGPLTMSVFGTGRFERSDDLIRVDVDLGNGTTATVYVAVWRSVSNPSILYLSTRPEGGDWTTHDDDGPLTMSVFGTGRFERSDDLIRVDVQLQ